MLQKHIDALLVKPRTFPGQCAAVAMNQTDIDQKERVARQFKHPAGTKIRLFKTLYEVVCSFRSDALGLLRIFGESLFDNFIPVVSKNSDLLLS